MYKMTNWKKVEGGFVGGGESEDEIKIHKWGGDRQDCQEWETHLVWVKDKDGNIEYKWDEGRLMKEPILNIYIVVGESVELIFAFVHTVFRLTCLWEILCIFVTCESSLHSQIYSSRSPSILPQKSNRNSFSHVTNLADWKSKKASKIK